MSQESIEVIRRSYEAWNRGDVEAVFEAYDPAIELHLPDGGINAGTYHGHQEVRAVMESYLDAFEYFRMEPERFLPANGQIVVVFMRHYGRGKGSGVEVEVRPAHVWTMRDGKAIRLDIIIERDEALEAAGLSEQDAHADSS